MAGGDINLKNYLPGKVELTSALKAYDSFIVNDLENEKIVINLFSSWTHNILKR